MKNEQKTTTVTLTCDQCQKTVTQTPEWYEFELVDDIGLKVFEKPRDAGIRALETRHLSSRKDVHFCSLDCAKARIHSITDFFLAEIKPPSDPKRRTLI